MDKQSEKKLKGLIEYIEKDLEPQLSWLRGEILKLDGNQQTRKENLESVDTRDTLTSR